MAGPLSYFYNECQVSGSDNNCSHGALGGERKKEGEKEKEKEKERKSIFTVE